MTSTSRSETADRDWDEPAKPSRAVGLGEATEYVWRGRDLGGFALKADAHSYDGRSFEVEAGQSYQVYENVPKDWRLTSLECEGGRHRVDIKTATAVVAPLADETILCIWVNEPVKLPEPPEGAEIIVKKVAYDERDTFWFSGPHDNRFSLTAGPDSAAARTFEVPAGYRYTVTEHVPDGWSLKYLTCSGGAWDADGATATISPKPGDRILCIWENVPDEEPPPPQKYARVTIKKVAKERAYKFEFRGPEGAFTLAPSAGGADARTFELEVGDYRFAEQVPEGWVLEGLSCTGGDWNVSAAATVVVSPDAGEHIICTFTNRPYEKPPPPVRTATITIKKYAHDAGGSFSFTGLGGFTLSPGADSSARRTVTVNAGGDYTVTELVPAHWELINLSCGGGDWSPSGASVVLSPDAGEHITCVFENRPLKPTKPVPKEPEEKEKVVVTETVEAAATKENVDGQTEVEVEKPDADKTKDGEKGETETKTEEKAETEKVEEKPDAKVDNDKESADTVED